MHQIGIKRGKKRYELVDEYGERIGIIELDMADLRLFERVRDSEKNILGLIEKAKNMPKFSEDETQAIRELAELDESIKTELNTLFACNVSEIVFGDTHCLTPHDGVTLVEEFLESILPYIKKDMGDEQKASKKRMAEYVKKG